MLEGSGILVCSAATEIWPGLRIYVKRLKMAALYSFLRKRGEFAVE